jgi:hypothetical protein
VLDYPRAQVYLEPVPQPGVAVEVVSKMAR